MYWLKLAAQIAASFAVVAFLGLTVLLLASALTGRGLPFTGGFTSSDERVPFDRLVITASDQGVTAEETPTSSATASPTPPVTTRPAPPPTATTRPAPPPTATPVASSAPVGVSAGSGDSAESIGSGSASASVPAVEASSETKGATTITWESSFADSDYALGNTVTMTVNWTVKAGAASYHSFALKDYTSSSSKDPAAGTAPEVTYPGSGGASSVDITFAFTGLHLDNKRNVEIGKAHFKLYLTVDASGDGIPDTLVGYGVNVHVEDPQT